MYDALWYLIFIIGPSMNAMHSIIAHELNHILDYTHMNITQVCFVGLLWIIILIFV